MKRISLNVKIVILFLSLYIILYNFIISTGINENIINILFWSFLLIISYFLIGYTKNRAITKKQTIQYVIIYCLIYLLLIYFLGIITGFNYSPFKHDFVGIIKNITPLIFLIIAKEITRYMLVFKCRFEKKAVIIIDIIFALLDIITVINLYDLSTGLLIFTFIGEVVLRSIYNNSLENLITYNVGPIPSIIYRLILELYVYIVPVIPDLEIYLTVVINISLPVLLFVCLNKLHFNYKNISKKKVSISKKYITIPLGMILITLVCFISGVFRYKMIAVASNSMLPVIERGDAIIYDKVDNVNILKKGDILVFVHDDITYVHKIVDVTKKNNSIIISTKGDNNATNDAFIVTEKDVVGVVKYEIKYIGYPSIWLSEAIFKE